MRNFLIVCLIFVFALLCYCGLFLVGGYAGVIGCGDECVESSNGFLSFIVDSYVIIPIVIIFAFLASLLFFGFS